MSIINRAQTSNAPILVSGASGHLGRRVLELLVAAGAGPIIATTRTPDSLADFAAQGVQVRRVDFDDKATLAPGFAGAKRALLISSDNLIPGKRTPHQLEAVRALEAAGVAHIAYTSLPSPEASTVPFGADHSATEAAIAATKLGYTFLRNNVYFEMLLHSLPAALASGKLVNARGDGKVAHVSREDCAAAAVSALLSTAEGRFTFEITGAEAFSSSEVAALASNVLGRPIEHVNVPAEDVVRGLVSYGAPQYFAEQLAAFDVGISRGEMAAVSTDIQRLIGKKPQSLRGFLVANRTAFA